MKAPSRISLIRICISLIRGCITLSRICISVSRAPKLHKRDGSFCVISELICIFAEKFVRRKMKRKRRKITIFDFLYYTIGREARGMEMLTFPTIWLSLFLIQLFPFNYGFPLLLLVSVVIYLWLNHYFEKRESFIVKHFDKTKYRKFSWKFGIIMAWITFWTVVPLLFLQNVFDVVSFLRNYL